MSETAPFGAPDTAAPKRIQLRRTKGWRKPEGAIVVARPSKWGNPWVLCDPFKHCDHEYCEPVVELVISHYRAGVLGYPEFGDPPVPDAATVRRELRGHDLACWCPLDEPCHADVLLELANERAGSSQ